MTYNAHCPLCGGALYPVVLDPESAPWVCMICRHGWWVTELAPSARAQFRAEVEDFGLPAQAHALHDVIAVEKAAAHTRGTSCREDQLALLPREGLLRLEGVRLDPAFRALVEVELARKGG